MRLRGYGFWRAAPWMLMVIGIAGAYLVVQTPRAESPAVVCQKKPQAEPKKLCPPPRRIDQWLTAQSIPSKPSQPQEKRMETASPRLVERLVPIPAEAPAVQPASYVEAMVVSEAAEEPSDEVAELTIFAADTDPATRDKNAQIRLSRYDREITSAGAKMLAPALLPPDALSAPESAAAAVAVVPPVEPPKPDVLAFQPDAEPLLAVRMSPARASASPAGRVGVQANPPPKAPPLASTAVALRPNAAARPASPPPRLSVVAEAGDNRTLRIKP